MKALNEYLNESHISALLHELKVGSLVQFKTSDMWIIGEVTELKDNDKVVVKSKGYRYKTEEEKKQIESKIKPKYTVAAKRCYLQVVKK